MTTPREDDTMTHPKTIAFCTPEEHEQLHAFPTVSHAMQARARCEGPDAIAEAQRIIDTISPSEDSNTRRAARALLCVWPSYDDDTLETGLSDLMTDIRHLCDLAGLDFYAIERQGKRGYDDERHACGLAEDAALAAAIKEDLA
jgi:hypothetical protein